MHAPTEKNIWDDSKLWPLLKKKTAVNICVHVSV